MKLRLSYKKGLKGTVLTLIMFNLHAWNYKKIPTNPWSLEVFGRRELSLGDHPTFGLNQLCQREGILYAHASIMMPVR